jgi:predicted anti-sigma-YlaC factor YlaD
MTHFSHETAAWNLALGVAFGWAASGAARRTGGLVPTIAAFVAPLLALSAVDLFAGDVTAGRLLGHLPVVAGLVLLLLHARLGRDGGGTRVTAHDGTTAHDEATGTGHGNSGFGGGRFGDGGLQPSAHHRAA